MVGTSKANARTYNAIVAAPGVGGRHESVPTRYPVNKAMYRSTFQCNVNPFVS